MYDELKRKPYVMTTPTQNQSNGENNRMYQDLPKVIKTMKNEPDDDFTKANLSQWDKDRLTDVNGCMVIMYNVVVKIGMILNEVEYSVGRGKWSNKHKKNGKADDNIPFLEWKTSHPDYDPTETALFHQKAQWNMDADWRFGYNHFYIKPTFCKNRYNSPSLSGDTCKGDRCVWEIYTTFDSVNLGYLPPNLVPQKQAKEESSNGSTQFLL